MGTDVFAEIRVPEDVHETLAHELQPYGNSAKQRFLVAHVLNHFDRNHPPPRPS